MAEAFGLAAGVLQVAGFGTEVGSALWTCARSKRYATKELGALADQVGATARCFNSVGTLLNDPETKSFHTSKLYEDIRAASDGCHEVFLELDNAVKKFSRGDGSKMTITARIQWPLNGSKLTEPLKVLKNYNDVLHLMLAVLQIVKGRRAATSDELRTLGESLQRLTLSNESLSKSNKTLTDMSLSIEQTSEPPIGTSDISLVSLIQQSMLEEITRRPCHPNPILGGPQMPNRLVSQPIASSDPTLDHLQRCMDAVHELAETIASAMNAWQGRERKGNSDVHESHAKLATNIANINSRPERKAIGNVNVALNACATGSELATEDISVQAAAYDMESKLAVQALLTRWLGDQRANTVLLDAKS